SPSSTLATRASFEGTRGGWVAGAGVETALAGSWTAKLEYLFVEIPNRTDSFLVPTNGATATETVTSGVHDHVVRLAVNYRFAGERGAPADRGGVVPARTWTGFHVGANAGYGVGQDRGNELLSAIPVLTAFSSQSFSHAPAGGLFGAQAGYDWQV